jgi:hypothetical protein
MRSNLLLFFLLALIAAISFVHIQGMQYAWYWKLWWLDIVMHFAGGFWLAIMVLWIHLSTGRSKADVTTMRFALYISAVVLLVGFMWEIFEVLIGAMSTMKSNYLSDTIMDLFLDVVGALIAMYFVGPRVLSWRKSIKT